MLPFQSLNGATSFGPGDVLDLGTVADHFSLAASASGLSTTDPYAGQNGSIGVTLEGSLDEVVWYPLATASVGFSTPLPSSVLQFTCNTSPGSLLARYVRANFSSAQVTTYPVSATVSAWVAANVSEEVP